jgi:hypothetical protein
MKLSDVKNGDMFIDRHGDLCIVTTKSEVVYFKASEQAFKISDLGSQTFGKWLESQSGPILGNINNCFAGVLKGLKP